MALLTIGAFATASRLSPKALRLYDDLGLLRPARTDPLTGYRRYAPEQLTQALAVADGFGPSTDTALASASAIEALTTTRTSTSAGALLDALRCAAEAAATAVRDLAAFRHHPRRRGNHADRPGMVRSARCTAARPRLRRCALTTRASVTDNVACVVADVLPALRPTGCGDG
jgi:DNA-binding transcriptional MerR regulator